MVTPVTVEELAVREASEMLIAARQHACNILSMAYDIAQREAMEDCNEIPRSRKVQVVNCLCEEGHIPATVRDEILQSLGFEEMDPV